MKVADGYALTGVEVNRDDFFGGCDCWPKRLTEGAEDKISSPTLVAIGLGRGYTHHLSALLALFHWHQTYLSIYLSI